ncbi:MAG: hypothetical protein WC807_13785 [Hyphomicrobium sp.]
MSHPTIEELRKRMQEHLAYRKDSDVVHLLWKGYLAALMEWGVLEGGDYHELNGVLKEVGEDELREIFLGFPDEEEEGP